MFCPIFKFVQIVQKVTSFSNSSKLIFCRHFLFQRPSFYLLLLLQPLVIAGLSVWNRAGSSSIVQSRVVVTLRDCTNCFS